MYLGWHQNECFGDYAFKSTSEMYDWIHRFEAELLPLERALDGSGIDIGPEYKIRSHGLASEALMPPPPQEVISNIRVILKSRYPAIDAA
jgi:hypothetical protein